MSSPSLNHFEQLTQPSIPTSEEILQEIQDYTASLSSDDNVDFLHDFPHEREAFNDLFGLHLLAAGVRVGGRDTIYVKEAAGGKEKVGMEANGEFEEFEDIQEILRLLVPRVPHLPPPTEPTVHDYLEGWRIGQITLNHLVNGVLGRPRNTFVDPPSVYWFSVAIAHACKREADGAKTLRDQLANDNSRLRGDVQQLRRRIVSYEESAKGI